MRSLIVFALAMFILPVACQQRETHHFPLYYAGYENISGTTSGCQTRKGHWPYFVVYGHEKSFSLSNIKSYDDTNFSTYVGYMDSIVIDSAQKTLTVYKVKCRSKVFYLVDPVD